MTGHHGHAIKGDLSKADRLYGLLDTLVAMRMDFGSNTAGSAAALMLGPAKIVEVREMLDSAIASTKAIIGDIDRPDIG